MDNTIKMHYDLFLININIHFWMQFMEVQEKCKKVNRKV